MILNYSTKISKDCVIRASVLKKVSVSEMLKIGNVFGMTLNLETDIVAIVKDNVVKEGARVERSNTLMLSKKEKLGVNALGEPTKTIKVKSKAPRYCEASRIHLKIHSLGLGGISLYYTTQPSKYGQYNYIHKRTMMRLAAQIINKAKTPAPGAGVPTIQKKHLSYFSFHPKSGKKLSPNSETAKQKAGGHPLVGEKNPDGKTIDMKGNLSHSENLPKALNREKGTDLTESLKEEPQFFHRFAKSLPVSAADFIESGHLAPEGSFKDQKIKKAVENQPEEIQK